MLDKEKLTGIGELKFLGGELNNSNDDFAGITLVYEAIHGEEDKTHPLNPQDKELIYGVN